MLIGQFVKNDVSKEFSSFLWTSRDIKLLLWSCVSFPPEKPITTGLCYVIMCWRQHLSVKGELINMNRASDKEILCHWQESNSWPSERVAGALSPELWEVMESKVMSSYLTGFLYSAQVSTVKVIVSSHKWIKMVNFKLGNETWKMNRSTWHERVTKNFWVPDRNRTHDLPNTSPLYPLSYAANSWRAKPIKRYTHG